MNPRAILTRGSPLQLLKSKAGERSSMKIQRNSTRSGRQDDPRSATLSLLVAACGAPPACGGFGFARNTATTFDVFYWLQVTDFDVLLNSAPNGPDYIDILGFCLHAQLFRSNVRF